MFEGKRVAVVGLARSGKAAAIKLAKDGAIVTIYDNSPFEKFADEILELIEMGITVYCGTNEIELEETDIIIVSPGIPPVLPFFAEAREMGIEIISEIELAYRLSPCPIIGITGTNGKTTTTVMTGKILKEAGIDYFIGGNVAGYETSLVCKDREGVPLISCVDKAIKSSVIACEISTFQLEECHKFRPKSAALLNVGTDHLDRHGTREIYANLKAKIFAFQRKEDIAVLNADDDFVHGLKDKLISEVFLFSLEKEVEKGCFLRGDDIIFRQDKFADDITIMKTADLKVIGRHNIANAMAAILLTIPFGISSKLMKQALSKFAGVTHRLEYIKTINGVDYINNSMCTNVEAGESSVMAIDRPQIVICGGKDKGSDFTSFAKAVNKKAKSAIIIGADKDKIAESFDKEGFKNYTKSETLKEALDIAKSQTKSGDVVVLTPVCASFDMFTSFEDRGNTFKELVFEL